MVRPTSETVIGEYLGKWVQSYRDLPLLLNQWANVVRWELRHALFLRTTEFLWQEGHTAHATAGGRPPVRDAHPARGVRRLHGATCSPCPVLRRAQDRERAVSRAPSTRMTCEGMMRDGKALQMGTSHELGQNFAAVFDIAVPRRRGRAAAVLDDVVGHVDADGGRR